VPLSFTGRNRRNSSLPFLPEASPFRIEGRFLFFLLWARWWTETVFSFATLDSLFSFFSGDLFFFFFFSFSPYEWWLPFRFFTLPFSFFLRNLSWEPPFFFFFPFLTNSKRSRLFFFFRVRFPPLFGFLFCSGCLLFFLFSARKRFSLFFLPWPRKSVFFFPPPSREFTRHGLFLLLRVSLPTFPLYVKWMWRKRGIFFLGARFFFSFSPYKRMVLFFLLPSGDMTFSFYMTHFFFLPCLSGDRALLQIFFFLFELISTSFLFPSLGYLLFLSP